MIDADLRSKAQEILDHDVTKGVCKEKLDSMFEHHKSEIIRKNGEENSHQLSEEEISRKAYREVRLDLMLEKAMRPRKPRLRW
jgi:hypothetical protein